MLAQLSIMVGQSNESSQKETFLDTIRTLLGSAICEMMVVVSVGGRDGGMIVKVGRD